MKSEGSNTWSNKNNESETKKNYKKKTLLSDRNRSRLEKRDKYNKYNTWSDKKNSRSNEYNTWSDKNTYNQYNQTKTTFELIRQINQSLNQTYTTADQKSRSAWRVKFKILWENLQIKVFSCQYMDNLVVIYICCSKRTLVWIND